MVINRVINGVEVEIPADDEKGDEDEGYEYGATEPCPHCDSENFYPEWDTDEQGYIAVCQECGEEIFLCDACMHADDNLGQNCDWHPTECGGECFRGKTTASAHKTA